MLQTVRRRKGEPALPGERMRLACWFWRPAKTNFVFCPKFEGSGREFTGVLSTWRSAPCRGSQFTHSLNDKVRAGETPTPARETRALPRNTQPRLHLLAFALGEVHFGAIGADAVAELSVRALLDELLQALPSSRRIADLFAIGADWQ